MSHQKSGDTNKLPKRRSPRLPGFDYSEPGVYFVTICTVRKLPVFGEVEGGTMRLSGIGRIASHCWLDIPNHFRTVRTRAFQVMPNHVHGVIEIVDRAAADSGVLRVAPNQMGKSPEMHTPVPQPDHVGAEYIQPEAGEGSPEARRASLSSVVACYKAAVTREMSRHGIPPTCVWQRGFYDRIIRDDREQFFVERYIELNPLMWYLSRNGAGLRNADTLRGELKKRHDLDEWTIERLVENFAHESEGADLRPPLTGEG